MSLSKDWQIKKLGEICELFIDGDWIESKDQSDFGIRLIQTGNIGNGFFKDRVDKARYISEDTFNRLNCNEVFPNDLLVSRLPDPVGRACLIPDTGARMITAVDCTIIRTKPSLIIPEYLVYYTCSEMYLSCVESSSGGATRKRISRKNLSIITIPIPPLPEQQRIVEILDEAFTGIDAAIANTERAIANSKELFDSELNRIFSQRGEGWATFKLEELCESISTGPFGSLLHKSDYVNFGTPLINPINIINDTIVPNEEKQVNDETLQRLQQYQLNINDIVVARRGEMGRCAVIGQEQAGWLCGTGCLFMRPSNKILSEFIAILLRSNYYRKQLEDVATGATMLNLSNKSLGDLYVSIPNIKGQSQLLNHLETLKNQTQALEAVYQQKLAALQELKQSLLHKAFTGELTAHWQGEA